MWQTVGTAKAATCGHDYTIQTATNDRGETVTRHDGYPDPDAKPFTYDANELCHSCYVAKMDRQPMTFAQMRRVWNGS